MNVKSSSNIDSLILSKEKTSIINLLPFDYDSSENGDDYGNSSQNSIDSSELVDDSDDGAEFITEIYIFNKNVDKIGEKSSEITID